MASSQFPILRGLEPLVSRLQDNIAGVLGPIAKALQNTPIMGAAAPPWTLAQLVNGFVAGGTIIPGFLAPAWQLDALGYVHLRGLAAHVAGTAATVLFTLPLRMRPSGRHTNSPDGGVQGLVVSPNGEVQCVAAVPALGFVSTEFIFQAGG